jgi:hypothetical protein
VARKATECLRHPSHAQRAFTLKLPFSEATNQPLRRAPSKAPTAKLRTPLLPRAQNEWKNCGESSHAIVATSNGNGNESENGKGMIFISGGELQLLITLF